VAKQALLILGIVIVFGIALPWYKGLDFLDPVFIAVYALLALFFVGPASAEAFAGEEPVTNAPEILRRSGTVLGYGWGIALLLLFAGMTSVNFKEWHGQPLLPPASFLIAVLLLSLTLSAVVVALSALLARRMTARAIKGMLRLIFLVVLIGVGFGNRLLPDQTRYRIGDYLTTTGIRDFAFSSSVVLGLAAAGLFFWVVRTAHLDLRQTPQEPGR
jgi:hypothetical protein